MDGALSACRALPLRYGNAIEEQLQLIRAEGDRPRQRLDGRRRHLAIASQRFTRLLNLSEMAQGRRHDRVGARTWNELDDFFRLRDRLFKAPLIEAGD